MEDSVIANNPILIVGFIAALLLGGYGLIKKARFCVTGLSVFLFLSTATYALLRGATLYEVGAVAALFFVINLLPLGKKGGK
ncbi:MAG: hypothetical protein KH054_05115 [Firmicutes bacterium]|jgi:hypothetical protein|nr:hypothetical protein [Clostridia bacterium]MBS5022516.1 hypothetical protein [Bacillota bacterium]